MLTKAGEAIAGAIAKAISIVLLGLLLYLTYRWATTHPEQAQALFNKAMNTLMSLANSFLNWLSTVGGN